VHSVDEAYSSTAAYERLRVRRRARGKRMDKDEIDRVAAAILLEAWMASVPPPRSGNQAK
jgi:RNase H-fold protein (predicted Holliday junction resolvase)